MQSDFKLSTNYDYIHLGRLTQAKVEDLKAHSKRHANCLRPLLFYLRAVFWLKLKLSVEFGCGNL